MVFGWIKVEKGFFLDLGLVYLEIIIGLNIIIVFEDEEKWVYW